MANLAIDASISLITVGNYSLTQAGIALIAGATGAAAAQRIGQLSTVARTVLANAAVGGTINVAAGAANGSSDYALNFALGAAGSSLGSGLGALTTSSNNVLFGVRGTATGAGRLVASGVEALLAGGNGFGSNNLISDSSVKPTE